jgi:hypothetical protein
LSLAWAGNPVHKGIGVQRKLPLSGPNMNEIGIPEVHDTLRSILRKSVRDPFTQCIADQLKIVLESLEGWEILSGLLVLGET